jgi:zinc protease
MTFLGLLPSIKTTNKQIVNIPNSKLKFLSLTPYNYIKMRKIVLILGVSLSLFHPVMSIAQAKLIEKVEKKGDELIIPYEKYVLPNGLTVILHEDKSDPVVHVDVTYHVGSAREELGKSGFAHFFEHMMFQGSDNVADEQHFKIITEAGGTLNGTTNRDRTNYFETVPSNQLEKMLWLEADRMGFLLDAVTQEKFEIQRATVKNERGQNYDNKPYGLMSEVSSKHLYPHGHPYSWMTIGYIEDLNRVGVQDLKNFFLRWYGPNNAVLTIGGNIDKKQTLDWVYKYFGSIPRGVEVTPAKFPIPTLEKTRFVTMKDNYAKVNKLRIVYPVPERFNKAEAHLDLLAQVLGQGKSSILYKNLVKTGYASAVSVYNYAAELAGEFTIDVTPYPGKDLKEIYNIINKSIEELSQRGITNDDITKFVNSTESALINGLESVSGKVSTLAAYYTFTKDANYLKKELEAYRNITAAATMESFNKFLLNKHSLVLSVVTANDLNNEVAPTNYTVDESKTDFKFDYGYEGLTYNKPKDNFDRKVMPKEGAKPVVITPKFYTGKIAESINIIGAHTSEIPTVNVIIKLKGGSFSDPKGKEGLASMFASMMGEDTKNYTAEQFSDELEKLGSTISISASDENIVIQLKSLVKNLEATTKLLEERLFNTVFNSDDFERNQKRMAQAIKNAMVRPEYIASVTYDKLKYDASSPLGVAATEASIKNITLSDIQEKYKNAFSRNNAEMIVVGDIAEKTVKQKFDFLKKLNNNAINLPSKDEIAKQKNVETKGIVYMVDVPNAAQTEFRIGKVNTTTYDHAGTHYKSIVTNYPLGGAFNSRLNLYLREEKGWTYGARSNFSANKYTGSYNFSGGIKLEPTAEALTDILKIISEYKEKGISAEELNFTKSALTNSEALKYETGMQKAGFLSLIQNYSLPANFKEQQQKVLDNITIDDINNTAKMMIPSTDEFIILLVGDAAKIKPEVEGKGFKVVMLDKDGNVSK